MIFLLLVETARIVTPKHACASGTSVGQSVPESEYGNDPTHASAVLM